MVGLGQVRSTSDGSGTAESDAGEEFVCFEQFSGAVHCVEREAGSTGDVEQRSASPSERLRTQRNAISVERASTSPPTARYRPRRPSWGSPFGDRLRYVPSRSRMSMIATNFVNESASASGSTNVEVVGRGVVLGVFAVRAATEATDRKVEAGGAVLAFVVPVRREVDDGVRVSGGREHVLRGAVDVGGAAPTALVRDRTAIAEPGQHQTVRDPAGLGVVPGEPSDRTDRAGHEEEPERMAPFATRQPERELPGHRQARAVVVRERGMARVRRHQDLAVGRARKDELAVRQASRGRRTSRRCRPRIRRRRAPSASSADRQNPQVRE